MQRGQVKHYNSNKGYGFISVANQKDDVFFHISNWQLSEMPEVGQAVYVDFERNDKNKLRATRVSASLDPYSANSDNTNKNKLSTSTINATSQNPTTRQSSTPNNNKSGLSRLLGFVVLIVAVVFGGSEVLSSLTNNGGNSPAVNVNSPSSSSNINSNNTRNNNFAPTGDAQVNRTIALIQQGGPFAYPNKDGSTFSNFEGRLPERQRGYYREYTVPTPNVSHRGARRIVTGGNPPEVYYLTLDHYESFKQLELP